MSINNFKKYIIFLFFITFSYLSYSDYTDEILSFENIESRDLYYNLIEELRCPKCQNQNLLDSNAPLAQDLKNQLYVLINDGYKKNEIKDYMRSRYGDFILYNPPLNSNTIVLWILPAILFITGVIILFSRFLKNDSNGLDNDK